MQVIRLWVLAVASAVLLGRANANDSAPPVPWPLWQAYVKRFVSPEGRVIDHAANQITTSEGQSYALFFALVDNDRARFERLRRWTSENLAGGRLGERLPAWKWGVNEDGEWGVLDENSAADADLWMAYSLLEGGRLWNQPGLIRTGRAMLAQVVASEVVRLPGLGPMLLPGPHGFVHGDHWRLNPSYLPLQLLAAFESADIPGPWSALRKNTIRLIAARSHHGFVDDWVGYRRGRGFIADPTAGAIGSYDAIRLYLWQALLAPEDPARRKLSPLLAGPETHWRAHGQVPEKVVIGRPPPVDQPGPIGFLSVLLPALLTSEDSAAVARLTKQLEESRDGGLYGRPARYYDQNLILFAQGFAEGRYRFGADGHLRPAWSETSVSPTP
jgi:endo-1,4-beta-D-glucanase Y